jgi:hypothetical protein
MPPSGFGMENIFLVNEPTELNKSVYTHRLMYGVQSNKWISFNSKQCFLASLTKISVFTPRDIIHSYCICQTREVQYKTWPPPFSSGQSSWLQIQRSRVRFQALPDFLRITGSGTGSIQLREYNWGATWKKSSGSGLENREYGRRNPTRWSRGTFYPQKAGTNFADKRRSLGRYSSLAE